MNYLKSIIGNHKVQFIGDAPLPGHPGAKKMENAGWFFYYASGKNVKTIGQCSREIKKVIFFRKNYK